MLLNNTNFQKMLVYVLDFIRFIALFNCTIEFCDGLVTTIHTKSR
jgi:hypothetical protein